jgi:DNA-binding GntR family transcriptional regulator
MSTRQDHLGRISRESTASVIARQLRDAIIHGSFRPGAQLGEAELAARLGVSRGPLREAMQRLVQEGLLRSEPNRGLFVIELTADDVHDIYLARTAIERAAIAALLDGDPVRSAAVLAKAHAGLARAAKRDDAKAVSDADLGFHQALVAEARSPRLRRMHDTLLAETRMCLAALELADYAPADVVAEHGAIVEAIRTRDRRRIERLLTSHADDALRRLVPDRVEVKPRRTRRRASASV